MQEMWIEIKVKWEWNMERDEKKKKKSTKSQGGSLEEMHKLLESMGCEKVPAPEGIRVRIYPAPKR